MNETLRSDLHEAKDHAKEAARATLMAMRSAIDFAIGKLEPGATAGRGAPGGSAESAAGEPEGTMTSPSGADDGAPS